MIYGVDVSSYQPEEFPLTTPGGKPVDFVIIKATQGLGYTNPRLQAQLDWARKNGLSVGFYHFADAGDIQKQADFFHAAIGPRLRPGDHLWFDWEKRDIASIQKDAWIHRMQADFPGYRVGLYCNRDFWLNVDESSFAGDALWIADWVGAGNPPRIEADWVIHQFVTDRGIDEDVADFASRGEMKAWAGSPVGSDDDLADVMEALDVIAQGIVNLGERMTRMESNDTEMSAVLLELKSAVAKLQTGQNALPKKVADEINKRMAQ